MYAHYGRVEHHGEATSLRLAPTSLLRNILQQCIPKVLVDVLPGRVRFLRLVWPREHGEPGRAATGLRPFIQADADRIQQRGKDSCNTSFVSTIGMEGG